MHTERKRLTASIVTKDTGGDTGGFEAVLSTPDVDRDGESIDVKSWGTLPESLPVNLDHEMSISGLVGTGVPRIEDGVVKLSVTFASTPEAQKARTLVNEGHIKATSVEFLRKTETDTKGVKTTSREMIGAALTNYPANPKAVVLSSKTGARNSYKDQQMVQQIHDHAIALGATPAQKAIVVVVDDDDDVSEGETLMTMGYAPITIEGVNYILTYCIDETTGEVEPDDLILDNTSAATLSIDTADNKSADTAASAAVDADSDAESFLFNARATRARLALNL